VPAIELLNCANAVPVKKTSIASSQKRVIELCFIVPPEFFLVNARA
jgi:hypothetical protein